MPSFAPDVLIVLGVLFECKLLELRNLRLSFLSMESPFFCFDLALFIQHLVQLVLDSALQSFADLFTQRKRLFVQVEDLFLLFGSLLEK